MPILKRAICRLSMGLHYRPNSRQIKRHLPLARVDVGIEHLTSFRAFFAFGFFLGLDVLHGDLRLRRRRNLFEHLRWNFAEKHTAQYCEKSKNELYDIIPALTVEAFPALLSLHYFRLRNWSQTNRWYKWAPREIPTSPKTTK